MCGRAVVVMAINGVFIRLFKKIFNDSCFMPITIPDTGFIKYIYTMISAFKEPTV